MTREELLKKIDFEKSWLCDCGIFGSDVDIAFHTIKNSVIEVLEQEPCEDAVSRQAVIDTICHECSGENLDIDFAKVLLLQRKIKALPSVNPQKPVLDKIRSEIMSKDGLEEAIKRLKEARFTVQPYQYINEALDTVIEALEQEQCEDAISRQAVIDLVNSDWKYEGLETDVVSLPSVNPHKIGHWIYDRTRDWDGECKYECSECGMGSDVDYAYCMRCGSKMVDPQESEAK